MPIENLGVSSDCIRRLKSNGFTQVEELVEFLEGFQFGTMIDGARWLTCFDEIMKQLKVLSLCSEEMERKWPSEE